MIQHIEGFHLHELSDKGFQNFVKYLTRKGFIAQEMLPPYEDKAFRIKTLQTYPGQLMINLGQLLEFVDERVPDGPYNIKRSASRNAWQFDHDEVDLNSSQPAELISTLWNIAKPYFERGTKIR